MRILGVSNVSPPGVLGGYELGCSHAVDALRARGHTVLVLTTPTSAAGPREPHVRRTLKLAPIYDRFRVSVMADAARRHHYAESNFVSPPNVHELAVALEDFDPEVVYAWNLFGLGGLGLVALLNHLDVPWVWHLMDALPVFLCSLEYPDVTLGARIPDLVREYGRTVRGTYIFCSRRLRTEIEAEGIELNGDKHVVPNWIAGPRQAVRQRVFAGDHLRVITAGQLGQHKGTDVLIEAAAHLKERGYANFSIDIYGIGDDSYFRDLINVREVRDHVRLRGSQNQDELLALYGEYDVFAFPTWAREPFGFAPLEAASRGCVPLMSANCGIAEWMVDGVHCVKAERTAEAFARSLGEIIEGRIDLAPLARRAELAVRRDFHLDTLVPRIEKILEHAAGTAHDRKGIAPAELYAIARLAEGVVGALIEEGT